MAMFVNEGHGRRCFRPRHVQTEHPDAAVPDQPEELGQARESPFKSDVYFFSTRTQLDQKWGTPNPITIRDKDFGIVPYDAFVASTPYHPGDPLSTRRFRYPRQTIPVRNWKSQLRNCAGRRHDRSLRGIGVAFIDMAINFKDGSARR